MSEDGIPDIGEPGTITVVDVAAATDPKAQINHGVDRRARKRHREDQLPDREGGDEEDDGSRHVSIPYGPPQVAEYSPPINYVNEQDPEGEEEEEMDEEEEHQMIKRAEKTDIQRLLDARHRRRRLGKHMAQDQLDEDLEAVKKFLELSEEDKEAYLAIYEYDPSKDNIVEGLGKATSLALRVGLAKTIRPKDYDFVSLALDMPEVKDSIAALWDCVDLEEYKGTKILKFAVAAGHIGDTLVGTGMKVYHKIGQAAELRDRKEQLERRRLNGGHSVFDRSAHHVQSTPQTQQPETQSINDPGGIVATI